LIDFDVSKRRVWFRKGIEKVIELSEKNRIAVICSEENPDRCHKKLLVGRELELLGFKVVHLQSKKP
jgi:uncharacterized protein (DUF488 family)